MNYKDEILNIASIVGSNNILSDLHTFNDEMTISQVVRFFEKNNLIFTKTMIQNYVRIGVIPPPEDKRYYTRKHIVLLSLINSLKNIYSLDEIKLVFDPVLKDPSTFDDDMMDITLIYKIYSDIYKDTLKNCENNLPYITNKIENIIKEENINENDSKIIGVFLTIINLMAQSIAIKKMVTALIDEFK